MGRANGVAYGICVIETVSKVDRYINPPRQSHQWGWRRASRHGGQCIADT